MGLDKCTKFACQEFHYRGLALARIRQMRKAIALSSYVRRREADLAIARSALRLASALRQIGAARRTIGAVAR
jgi:hypothetical protein